MRVLKPLFSCFFYNLKKIKSLIFKFRETGGLSAIQEAEVGG